MPVARTLIPVFDVRGAGFITADTKMRLRIPDPIPQRFLCVPPEPPVQHVFGHLGYMLAHGYEENTLRHPGPAILERQIPRIQERIELLKWQGKSGRIVALPYPIQHILGNHGRRAMVETCIR